MACAETPSPNETDRSARLACAMTGARSARTTGFETALCARTAEAIASRTGEALEGASPDAITQGALPEGVTWYLLEAEILGPSTVEGRLSRGRAPDPEPRFTSEPVQTSVSDADLNDRAAGQFARALVAGLPDASAPD